MTREEKTICLQWENELIAGYQQAIQSANQTMVEYAKFHEKRLQE